MPAPTRRRIRPIGAERTPHGERISAAVQRATDLGVAARERSSAVEAGFQALQRELDYGGGLLAGGLAYRLFLWLLPIGLVGAQILGFWVDSDEESVEGAARHFGIGAAAIASAANAVETSEQNRFVLLAFGLVLLAWFSLGFVRALVIAYSLAWGLPRPKIRRPLHAIVFFNGVVLAVAVATAGLGWLREEIGLFGILGVALTVAFQATMTLVVMWFLPHRSLRWPELLPGALLVALGSQAIAVAVAFYFAPKIGRSSELYGTLGAASVLLVWLYVLARLITSGAFLNVTLWERRHGSRDDGVPPVDDHGLAADHPGGG